MGKTTFCSKLAQDWAEIVKGRKETAIDKLTEEQCHLLSNIGLILYIVFRDTNENQSLDDIVKSQIIEAISKDYSCINVCEDKYHNDILLVYDGLDEVSYAECELLEIIEGRVYPNIRCIVTCRPHASLGMSLTADAEIRLKGFSKEQAQHFVNAYFESKFPNDKAMANKYSFRLWHQIETSIDLTEMAQNPSMLQLLCKLFLATGKISKDKASVFQDYTTYLLHHYHIKQHKEKITKTELTTKYKSTLQKAGKLALQGLKQSHLQLIFTKESVLESGGIKMFDIGFVSEIPGHATEHPKAQFVHKTHQEYLAAFFIVNSSEDVGLKYLMEFCSTSKGLMGSQIILTFITAMSKKMGKVIQKQIRELVSSWASEDDISPKDRTSFLLTMLKENKSLVFPLPKEIDIDIREHEKTAGWFKKFLQLFDQNVKTNLLLVTFFGFKNGGVQKIAMILGKKNRLELLNGFRNSQLKELVVNFKSNAFDEDIIHTKKLVQNNTNLEMITMTEMGAHGVLIFFTNKELMSTLDQSQHLKIINIRDTDLKLDTELAETLAHIPNHIKLDISGNRLTDQSGCASVIKKAAHLESLIMQDCGIKIDTEIAEAVSRLPDYAQLDISGNQVTDKSACITLIRKAASMKSLNIHNCMSNCGIKIDTEIAEAVSRLPDHTQLDLSGNQVTDKSACITLIHEAATIKSLNIHNCMSNCGIKIDTEIAEAVSRLPDHTQLDLSGNKVTDRSACITLIHKAATMKSLNIHDCMSNCGIKIDTEIAEAVSRLPDQTQLDLTGNQVTDKSACITVIHKAATIKSLSICNCDIQIDTEIVEAVSRLPDHTQLDLSGNKVTDKSACISLIHKAATMKSLSICKCGIQIDTEIAEAVSMLPDHTLLDLSGNQVTDKSACITLIHKAVTMKSLSICNCGIKIDTEIAEAVSRLPDHTQLDLSGNQVTDKSACITLIHKAATMKSLNIHNCMSNCGIKIDTEIAEAVSRLPDHTQLDLSGNQVTDKSACISLIHKAATMKSLNTHNCMSNCGIKIDTKMAEAVSRLPDHTELDLSGNQVTGKSACVTLIHKAATMKSLNIHNCMSNCGIKIDTKIAEAVSRLPDHTELDLSGNQVTGKSACVTLINKAATMKSLNIHNCMSKSGIKIDTEIAEAVSRLPDHTQLDLSGNDITEMKPYLLSRILLYMTKQEKINIAGWGITVDEDIVRALSKLPKLQTLVINYYGGNNKLTSKASSELPHTVSSMPHLQVLHLDNCDISNDVMVALTDSLYKHCPLLENLYLYNNHLSSGVWEVVKHIQKMKNLRGLGLYGNPCMEDDKQRDKIETILHRSNPGLDVAL